jgi:hypothetical protein
VYKHWIVVIAVGAAIWFGSYRYHALAFIVRRLHARALLAAVFQERKKAMTDNFSTFAERRSWWGASQKLGHEITQLLGGREALAGPTAINVSPPPLPLQH